MEMLALSAVHHFGGGWGWRGIHLYGTYFVPSLSHVLHSEVKAMVVRPQIKDRAERSRHSRTGVN